MTEQWSGWIPWAGGENPIPWAKAGEWGYSMLDMNIHRAGNDASVYEWQHFYDGSDLGSRIIAYRYRLDRAPKGWRPPARERTVYTEWELDECVVYGSAHLERLDKKMWFLSLVREDGSELAVWLTGVIEVEERKAK